MMLTRYFILLLLLGPCMLQAQVSFSETDLTDIATAEMRSHTRSLRPVRPNTGQAYDVKWYRCSWNIDPGVRQISGAVTTYFIPGEPAFDSLVLDLSSSLTVDSVLYHGNQATKTHVQDLLTIRFPASLPQGITDSVSVYYQGVPPENGFGAFTQSMHDNTPVIWTLSEPYGSSDWWPCKNGLTDKADSMDIVIRSPHGSRAASNGILLSETTEGADIVAHWKHRYPIAPYLVCLAVTNYACYSHEVPYGGDTLEVVNYIYREDSASVSSQTGIIVPLIQLFDTLFGIYPFQNEKYGHAQFGWGGGMEHQTMTFVSSFGFELLAHELAHQWFGDMVTCGSWTDIWLNEGFATYLSGLCYEHLAPVYWQRFREVRVKNIISNPGGSVYCADTTSVNRIFDGRLSYAKGAMILHQLRWIMGDSAFFAALNNYLYDPMITYSFSRTQQLKDHLESASGMELSGYFDDWYTGEGYPSYQANWGQEGDTVSLTLHQTQSHPSVSFFEMPVPVQFKNAERDTILRFLNTYSGQSFSVLIPFPVDSVIIDPEYQLISGNNKTNAVQELMQKSRIEAFPNPADDQVTFSLMGQTAREPGRIYIFDFSGRLVEEAAIGQGASTVALSVGHLSPGLYFYQYLQSGGKFVIRR